MKSNYFFIIGIVALGLLSQEAVTQDLQQRNWLIQHASETNLKWTTDRAYAESVAVAKGFPIKKTFSDGTVIELQRIENGIPRYYTTQNLNAARTISTNKVWPGGGAGFSLTGSGDTLGIWDEGKVNLNHQEFATGRVTQVDNPQNFSNHSTHVAGTMIASGVQANAKGMSYQARLRAWDWNSDRSEMASAALNGLRVSNHSYGFLTGWAYNLFDDGRWVWFGDTTISNVEDYSFGYYSYESQQWDNVARNAPYYLIVKSAGNDRLQGPSSQPVEHWVVIGGSWVLRTVARDLDGGPSGYDCLSDAALSKNVLSVGAVNDITNGYTQPSDVVMSGFSAWGPTDDGRIKPDIVANGTSLYSAIATSTTSYDTYSGTSMAAPNVSGSLGLLLQYHKSLYGNSPMRASTMKALVIHTADEAGANAGPDYAFGWGLMNTQKAINLMQLNYQRGGSHMYERVLTQGQVVEIPVHTVGSEPLRVTICWADPAGTPIAPKLDSAARMLVNDIDLRLIKQGGSTYSPYVLNPSNPSAGATTGDNIRDNVEQVHLQTPSAGQYTIRVTHKGTLSGGSQIVSIIVSGTDDVLVTVDQKLADGQTSVDSVGRWESGSSFATYAVPKQFSFSTGTQEVIRGAQKIISNQKYNKWSIDDTVTNYRKFLISASFPRDLISNFNPANNATLQAQLLEGGSPGGYVNFKDPWLIDYPDPNYGNNLRNQGMSAPFKSVAYAANNLGTGTSYKGVFLNQSYSGTNYYSVSAPAEQTFGGVPGYFSHWGGNGVTYQDASAQQTGVVFNSAGATVTANYKGHLITNAVNALASNGQRKIIQDEFDLYHLVYESGGNIYASYSDGQT